MYNLVPPKNMPAQFAFTLFGINTFLDAGVRTGGDNGITEHVDNIVETPNISGNTTTLWGTPSDPSHDNERCALNGKTYSGCSLGASSSAEPKPF